MKYPFEASSPSDDTHSRVSGSMSSSGTRSSAATRRTAAGYSPWVSVSSPSTKWRRTTEVSSTGSAPRSRASRT